MPYVAKILGKPKNVEIPGRVGQKFGHQEAPDLPEPEQSDPRNADGIRLLGNLRLQIVPLFGRHEFVAAWNVI
jgi:hypothetical protein